jgi:acyl-homoserine-lactone acylase
LPNLPSIFGPILLAAALGACSPGEDDTGTPDPYDVEIGPYQTTVRWTGYGVPHILADDYGSLGYGLGYAFARDHICTLADQVVKVRSERARYFGPGENDEHLDSDFGWLALGVFRQAEEGFLSLPDEVQAALVGYTAGYNRWLAEVGPDGLPEPCRNAEWVKPLSHIDLTAYHLHLSQFGSGYVLADLVATAQPPDRRRRIPPPPLEALADFRRPPLGSNGWAIGGTRSEAGRGMVLSNTHFPSEGERQWHEFHLTIPGQLNTYGAGLVGVPLVNLGFNDHVAWTHTVSNTPRLVVYLLDLDPGDPTRYRFDGDWREMTATVHRIEVRQPDGSLETVERTLYRSHYGPMFNAPLVGWAPLTAFTYRDVNENHLGLAPTWLEMNLASGLEEFQAAHRTHQGIPWVHTLYADDQGNAFYTDSATTPNLSPETEAHYRAFVDENFYAGLFASYGVVVIDGGDPSNAWVEDPAAAAPGAIPFDDCPQLLRDDFVSNANQNYWLASPFEPLTGYPMLYGEAPHLLTPRTRMNNMALLEGGEDAASGADHLFSLEELEAVVLSARGSMAEVLRDQVVARCQGVDLVTVMLAGQEEQVDISEACDVLAAWDGRSRPDSVGAHVWRETLTSGTYSWTAFQDRGNLFADDFDPEDPVWTPTTLAPAPAEGTDRILQAIGRAVLHLEEAGIALDAELGTIQYRVKGEERIPTLGGPYQDGVMAIASYEAGNTTLLPKVERPEVVNPDTDLTTEGYVVNAGNSWIMVMEFTDDGPRARAVMTYSQSEDPASPHFADQSRLYAQPSLRPVRFTEEEILDDPSLEVLELSLDRTPRRSAARVPSRL